MSSNFCPALFLFYILEPHLSSLYTNISFFESLQWLQQRLTMVNMRTLTSLTYLAQVAILGGYAQINASQLVNVLSKREVLYVGGQYTNITVRLFCWFSAYLITGTGSNNQFHVHGYFWTDLCRETFP
jgi:hypothetical protein